MTRGLFLLAALAVGCSRPPAAPPGAAWPDELAADEITFGDPEVDRQFQAIDAAARRLAGADWEKRNDGTYRRTAYPQWGHYEAHWAGPQNRARTGRSVEVRVELGRSDTLGPGEVGFFLAAVGETDQHWIARIGYRYGRRPGEPEPTGMFTLTLQKYGQHFDGRHNGIDYRIGRCEQPLDYARETATHRYSFRVQNITPGSEHPCRTADAREVVPYWRSAESFRDAELAVLDRMLAGARTGLGRGRADTVREKKGANRDWWPEVDRPVPDEIKADVLRSAEADVEKRRAIVREHHKEMHAAAVAAFPELADILDPGG